MADSFGARARLDVGDDSYTFWRLDALSDEHDVDQLPYSLRILLENLLRREDGVTVTADDVTALASWQGRTDRPREIAFAPARVLMQDFTGVPAIVDLAAMRDAVVDLGGDPADVNPGVPVDLVIDHSVVADVFGLPQAFARNVDLEYERNAERYAFLRWGQQAFDRFRVVPPGTGIVHQVNLEHLASVVFVDEATGAAYPDTLVGTDSHTPMVNGLGVVGWGVGGIEAEAALLGQPVSMLIPEVVGIRIVGELQEGVTATDLVLTVTEMLRQHGVVGRFVEFFGPGVGNVAVADRATIGNMSPEYGSTITVFPIDDATLRYLRFTGRREDQVRLVEAYAKEQGLFHDPDRVPTYTSTLELDLSSVESSLAGPSRPQDRVPLRRAKRMFREALAEIAPRPAAATVSHASEASFPASDPPAAMAGVTSGTAATEEDTGKARRAQRRVPVTLEDGTSFELDHGHVVIAAITSCTNTSNPRVMLAAGLLAKNAVEAGLERQPWVKTTLAPGSQVVTDYYERAGLTPYLEKLGFYLVGYGCTTCIGNSGPLPTEISAAIDGNDLAVASVLSGNRNFAGRIHQDVRMNYLASPPLVVAYALAGTMDRDLYDEPLGTGSDGQPVHLRDIWPSNDDITAALEAALDEAMFVERYRDVFTGDDRWRSMDVPAGDRFAWDDASTYVQRPPFFEDLAPEPAPVGDIVGARVLAVLGDSVTTDHISPAGAIPVESPAGRYLVEHGVQPRDFNSYGSRRGNHEVMMRGTFGNVRLRNRLVPGVEGGVTRHLPTDQTLPIYEAAVRYLDEATPLVILAGAEYGSGSSRDWAAKGTVLLGVRAVIAESFERIHRSNLIGMGVLPLQFREGDSVGSLGLTGEEEISITGLEAGDLPDEVTVRADGTEFRARIRIDTPLEAEYFRHGGILHYVLRRLAGHA